MKQIDLELFKKNREAAQRMIAALCRPRGSLDAREWIMSIPAQPDYDPDLVIGRAIMDEEKLIKYIEMIQPVLDVVKKYTRENVIENNNSYMWEALQILYILECHDGKASGI